MSDLTTPKRQSPLAILFILGRTLRILLRQFWVVILVVMFNSKKQVFNSFTLSILGMALFGAVGSILSYFRLYYYIKDDELILEKGIIRRKKLSVPLERIQSVNFKQGILHQVLNVVSIEIDTAGSAGREFSLQALAKEDAEQLRDTVEKSRKSTSKVHAETFSDTEHLTEIIKKEKEQKLLFQLSPLDLIKIGISQNHFRTAGIIMVFFLSFFDDLEEALDINLSKKFEEFLGMAQDADFLPYLLIGVPFFFAVSFIITLFRTVLQYFNLKFWRLEKGFRMESGLFTKQEVYADLGKLQFVRWDSSPLKRLYKMVSVRLPQAASVQVSRRLSANVPGCYLEHLEAIRHAYFPDEKNHPETQHGINWRMAVRMFIIQGIFPVAVGMLLSWNWFGSDVWSWLLWLPFALWLSIKYYKTWYWRVSEEGIRTSWGVLNRHNVLLQWYKVQAVTIRQNVFLKRRGLAHLILYTAAGAVSVPYIEIEKAQELKDYVLAKVEKDNRDWM